MSDAARHFQFISIQGPNKTTNQIAKRQARSHAVKCALENKRKLQQSSGDNFRSSTSKWRTAKALTKRARIEIRAATLSPVSAGTLDPFQTLAVDSSRLQTLLNDYQARQAPEPVFSVAEELAFQDFRSVFRTGFVDPALMNAVMLSLAVAATGGSDDRECLVYRVQAISHIRKRMDSPNEATSESTIGAILLLAGVEARSGLAHQAQLHIEAVHLLLQLCQAKGVRLTDGIKRGIFWQDLNCSILTGSRRMVDHTTFAELKWTRDSLTLDSLQLSLGFQERSHLFSEEFLEVLEDVQALQCIRDIFRPTKGDLVPMAQINNQIASIQSRLLTLPDLSPISECCRLAAYVCSMMLCCKVWCALVVPTHIASQLLHKLQEMKKDPLWNNHPDLLLWLLCVGGAFLPLGPTRSGYVSILRSNSAHKIGKAYKSWPQLLYFLKRFVWSENAFKSHVKILWDEVVNPTELQQRSYKHMLH